MGEVPVLKRLGVFTQPVAGLETNPMTENRRTGSWLQVKAGQDTAANQLPLDETPTADSNPRCWPQTKERP